MRTTPLKTLATAVAITGILLPAGAQQTSAINSKTKEKPLELTVDLSRIKYPVDQILFTFYNTTTKVRYTDSAAVTGNKVVVFKTAVEEPILAQLRVVPVDDANAGKVRASGKRDIYSLYIEPGKLKAVAGDSLGATEVTGSASHADYVDLKKKAAAYEDQFNKLYEQYGAARKQKDSVSGLAARKAIDSLQDVVNEKVYKEFVKTNGKRSPVALYALSQYTGYSIDPAKAEPVYNLLGPAIKNLPAGIAFRNRIEIAKQLEIGKYAIPFTQNDTLDHPVTLASFKGKYVLVDFWASWCLPCRAENPNVVAAFDKYKDKDFTVLGVSLDRPGAKERWLKAIHDDQLAWTHVSDLKYWDNEVAKLYDVKAIPQNFLLDKEGKIVAKNIRGEELATTLAELIK